jgi:hypothetical protein
VFRRIRQSVIIRNEDVEELTAEIPEGHIHMRTTIKLRDGMEIVFQEATAAAVARAYVTLKTHPTLCKVRLTGKKLEERKEGYAEWQLMEECI